LIRASGFIPCAFAYSSATTRTAEAPSVRGEEVPAVTEPSASKAGLRPANASRLASGRIVPSVATVPPFEVIGMISSSNLPSSAAAAARRCEVTASSSCFTREI
jgi:hypothetical protein